MVLATAEQPAADVAAALEAVQARLGPPSSGERIDGNVQPRHRRILAARRVDTGRGGCS